MENFQEISKYFTADCPADLKRLVSDAIEQKAKDNALIKKEIIKEAELKKPYFFRQLDGFANAQDDEVIKVDKDGDVLYSCNTWELRDYPSTVELLLHEDSNPDDVIRILKKMVNLIEHNPEMIADQSQRNQFLNNIKAQQK